MFLSPRKKKRILVGNKLRGKIETIGNYIDFHICELARLFVHYIYSVYT
jgi:hypothetical protein